MEFVFSKRAKNITMILMVIGLIAIGAGVLTGHHDHYAHLWSVLLTNSLFFLFIGLGAFFFYALQYATETAWTVLVKRIFEGIFSNILWTGIALSIVLLASVLGFNHLYHWMDPALTEVGGHHFDKIIAGKSAYLNKPFFSIRTLVYLATFIFGAYWFRKQSVLEDQIGGTELHFKMYKRSAVFLIFFAVFSSTLAWDWVMSLDPHWFSTLFGWYVFASFFVSGITTIALITLYLKSKGYLEHVNTSHIHDLAKFIKN